MKVILHPDQKLHDPRYFLANGVRSVNPEQPERVDRLLAGAKSAGLEPVEPTDYGLAPLSAVHSPEYIQFLKNIFHRWQRMPGASQEVIPNLHPANREGVYPKSAIAQTGYHTTDTNCPISAKTYQSICWSVNSAVHAASLVYQGTPMAYALCRPPGHHAFRDLAGGFCYFNNTAVAAQWLCQHGMRPAVVDVDLHHGNGTQGIFYNRDDVLTVSVHADPSRFYPFYWGHACERGADQGVGYNLNLPIPRGSRDEVFLQALEIGLERVDVFGPSVLVIALGLDGFEGDPIAGLAITTRGFEMIGTRCAGLNLPTVIVQEGGYLCPALGDNLTAFLSGFKANHRMQDHQAPNPD